MKSKGSPKIKIVSTDAQLYAGQPSFLQDQEKNVSTCAIYKITRFYGHMASPLVVQTGTGSHKVYFRAILTSLAE